MNEEIQDLDDLPIESSTSYLNEIARIKRSNQAPDVKLDLLNMLVKDYFRKKYHAKKNSEYSELINFFLDKKRPHVATFCHEMVEELYSGEELNEGRVQLILDDAKTMFVKEFDLKERNDSQPIKKLLNPFSTGKKGTINSDPENISKQTKKAIEKLLGPEEKPIVDNDNENKSDILEQEEELESLKTKLTMSNKEKSDSSPIDDNPEGIQSIDDLERIKDKIRMRKMSNYEKIKEKS